MTPLGPVSLGLVLVLVDVRGEGVDLVPDLLGWVLVLAGVHRLARLDPRFAAARSAALVSAFLSLPDAVGGPPAADP